MVYDTLKSCSPSPVLVRAVSQSGGICFSEKWRRARVIGKFANSLTIISANAIGACINNTGRRTRDESLPLQRLEPNASLSQVCQPQSHLSKSGYSDPSIHSESGHQPPRMSSLCLAFFSFSFFASRLAVWQDCGQVGVQVCPLIQNDRWPLSLLPGDSGLAGMTGRASCTSGRQGDRPDPAPRSCDRDEVSARNVSWNYLFTRGRVPAVRRVCHARPPFVNRWTTDNPSTGGDKEWEGNCGTKVSGWNQNRDTAGILYVAKNHRSIIQVPSNDLYSVRSETKKKKGIIKHSFGHVVFCLYLLFYCFSLSSDDVTTQ